MANDQKNVEQTPTAELKVKPLSKSETWKKVEALMEEHNLPEKTRVALAELLEPKNGGGNSQHPPKLDKDGNIIEAWCKYHECYEPINNMVVSNGKSKGYCKAASSKSNRLRKLSKEMDAKVVMLTLDGDFEGAQEMATKAKELSEKRNSPEMYNLEEDWKVYNAPRTKTNK